jgi:8-oxo-dGTP pyrophosphatase MutT (NUDIX family)
VIPKGNIMRAVPPHVAAAIEAEEEGGVRGDISPTALGAFRYRKTRRDGSSQMLDVDVFPLAVTEELSKWKEKGQRERRWFSLADAADAVEEEDLAAIIRAFNPEEIPSTAPAKHGKFARLKRLLP